MTERESPMPGLTLADAYDAVDDPKPSLSRVCRLIEEGAQTVELPSGLQVKQGGAVTAVVLPWGKYTVPSFVQFEGELRSWCACHPWRAGTHTGTQPLRVVAEASS